MVASMKEGTLYCEYAGNVTALREEVGEAYTSTCYHLGYAYLALGNTVYRYRQKDGANETVVYTASDRIQALTADRYALYFLTDDGLYQLFRPTGQLKRLVENDGTQYTYLSRLSEDILLYGNNAYSLTYNRVFDWDSLVDAYTAKQDTLEIQGFPMTDDFKAWLKEYCAKNPA